MGSRTTTRGRLSHLASYSSTTSRDVSTRPMFSVNTGHMQTFGIHSNPFYSGKETPPSCWKGIPWHEERGAIKCYPLPRNPQSPLTMIRRRSNSLDGTPVTKPIKGDIWRPSEPSKTHRMLIRARDPRSWMEDRVGLTYHQTCLKQQQYQHNTYSYASTMKSAWEVGQ